jgi:hypothetical protein
MFIRDIKKYLKNGSKPHQIPTAKKLGNGIEKAAYLVGEIWVVKE